MNLDQDVDVQPLAADLLSVIRTLLAPSSQSLSCFSFGFVHNSLDRGYFLFAAGLE
jgi:hypothetical protein